MHALPKNLSPPYLRIMAEGYGVEYLHGLIKYFVMKVPQT